MSVFDSWAESVADILRAESQFAGSLVKHPVELGDAREALIRSVLKRILPSAYEIGRGEIIDAYGNRSRQIDIVISRPDSPSLLLPSGSRIYLIESVLATIEVKSELTGGPEGTLSDALENCASVANLVPKFEAESVENLYKVRGMLRTEGGDLYHNDSLSSERFTLCGYPPSYVFGFRGYSQNLGGFTKAIYDWAYPRVKQGTLYMKHIPAVIASQGCFCVRNADPFAVPDAPDRYKCIAFTGRDPTPIRMLIAHLLTTLLTKMPWTADADGLKPDPTAYLHQMKGYKCERTLFCKEPPENCF